MPWVYISDIGQSEGQEVTLKGWLYNKRSSGKLHFLQVRDGTGVLQCVMFKNDVPPEQFALAEHMPQESSLIVTGNVRADARAALGYELSVKDLQLVHAAEPYPITPKEHGVAFLLDHRHLWLRSSRQHAILRIRSAVVRACRDYFNGKGFTLLDAPIFTPAACEGTTTLFATDYFGETAYLTQSGQLYAEAGALAFGKVYCFGPTFRAEKSKTRRHLTEFWMVEPEVAYLDLAGDMDLAEDFVEYVVQRILRENRRDLEALERDLTLLERVRKPFPRITYSEAVELVKQAGFPIEWGADFGGDEETAVSKSFDRPVLVHRYPTECKAFYMKADPADPRLALCVDMLAPEGYGEIIGGGQREDDLETLRSKIHAHQLPEEAFGWYLDLRRYGSVPHAGFGMGIERVVAWICNLPHVRETVPFPRMLERLRP
ncbi:MAG TPA: asparagine--tRNA ligase [Candidatus Acidoferrales bacterium]|nr:asparagine--tRNA ligase [Candidatus Acidoferrales bacterium]